MMLNIVALLLIFGTVSAFESKICCCGCEDPCPIKLKDSCGAPAETPCVMKSNFNKDELLSPCSLIIKLHKYELAGVKPSNTTSETVDSVIERSGSENGAGSSPSSFGHSFMRFGSQQSQFVPIGRNDPTHNNKALHPITVPRILSTSTSQQGGGVLSSGSGSGASPSGSSGSSSGMFPFPDFSHMFSSIGTGIGAGISPSGGKVISDKVILENGIPTREIIRQMPDGGISVTRFTDDGKHKSVEEIDKEAKEKAQKFASEFGNFGQHMQQAMAQMRDSLSNMFNNFHFPTWN